MKSEKGKVNERPKQRKLLGAFVLGPSKCPQLLQQESVDPARRIDVITRNLADRVRRRWEGAVWKGSPAIGVMEERRVAA